MEIWPQRSAFRAKVTEYRTTQKITLAKVAELVGLEESTLKDYLYKRHIKPSLEVLQKAAALFGCSVTEFLDDPGAEIAGQDLSGLSESKRFAARVMMEDMKAEDLSDEDILTLMEDHRRALERLRAFKARFGRP